MLLPAFPDNEWDRQAAVDQLHLTDLEVEEAFERIAGLLASLLKVPMSVFTVIDRERAFVRASSGLQIREVPRSLSLCSHCILQDEVFIVNDAREHPWFSDSPFVTGPPHLVFYAGVPVHAPNGLTVGTLCVMDSRPRSLTPEMQEALVILSGILEDELRLRLLSSVDHLTGLFNRRHFDDVIQREWNRACRNNAPISLLAIDIDRFKVFNDQYGHLAGDDCLRRVSATLRQECNRSGDQLFRTGGEEFAVVLPGTGAEGAQFIAHSLRLAVHALAIPNAEAQAGAVTISVGVASAGNLSRHALRDFIKCSDDALYAAKAAGRDRVVARNLDQRTH